MSFYDNFDKYFDWAMDVAAKDGNAYFDGLYVDVEDQFPALESGQIERVVEEVMGCLQEARVNAQASAQYERDFY